MVGRSESAAKESKFGTIMRSKTELIIETIGKEKRITMRSKGSLISLEKNERLEMQQRFLKLLGSALGVTATSVLRA